MAGRVAQEPEQAAEHAAGAAVQVVRERDEGAVLVAVEPQGSLDRGDESGPFLARGERAGRDEGEPAGDLVAAGGDVEVVDLVDFTDRRESQMASDLR